MSATLFDKSRPGRPGYRLPAGAPPAAPRLDAAKRRRGPVGLPALSELDVMRHFVALSKLNHSIVSGFYPLGSCTMKYNPVLNEELARLPGFAASHPDQCAQTVQGNLELMWRLEEALKAITGFAAATLQPAAGAQGEFVGMRIARRWHEDHGAARREVLIPDSAHGTNPASVVMAGLGVRTVPSDARGLVDLAALAAAVGPDTAAVMLTNPNTLGLFETDILRIAELVHGAGALLYMDGANMNALVGRVRPAELGFDVMHLNLHKTFATPHGGGGPGSGPVAVTAALADYLPGLRVRRDGERFTASRAPRSIGDVHGRHGNFAMLVRALAYILRYGGDGLADISAGAVLNANYLQARLRDLVEVPHDGLCMHEFVASGRPLKKHGVRTLDVAKRLLDFGIHAPTVYFPLIVPEALMIEPTETETKESLDRFVDAMAQIVREAETDPELLRTAPHTTPVGRLDEARAAKELRVVQPPAEG
ncbi:MAG: aminomethyl-transferring glycine dehydrogenase subunit GcvPB [Candidatus Krumholzibacteriota bacterium]|nr:aminomethyl-transferring glycine dehydrogenase subunit GcvPB [Candidatus Krumholzibacteriota bacterium]